MKTTTKTLLFLAVISFTAINFQSCGKYEDGPGFSLRTKKARITGEWELVKINGQTPEQYLGYSSYDETWEVESDGDIKIIATAAGYNPLESNGEWEFSSNKEDIEITIDGFKSEFEILKLKNKESKFKTKTGASVEYEFEKK